MTLTLTQITGIVDLPNGDTPRNGKMEFQLRGWDMAGSNLIMPGPVIAQLSAEGALDVWLQASTVTERQMVYDVAVSYWSAANSLTKIKLPPIALPVSLGVPTDINELLQIPAPDNLAPDILAQTLAARALAETAAGVASGAASVATAASGTAVASATASGASAAQAALYDGPWLDTVAAVVADTSLTYTAAQPGTVVAGDYVQVRVGGGVDQVLAQGTPVVSPYIQTSGNVVLKVLPDGRRAFVTSSFGTGNLSAQFAKALDASKAETTLDPAATWLVDRPGIIIPPGVYDLDAQLYVFASSGLHIMAHGAVLRNLAGAFTPFKIVTSPRVTIDGMSINMRGNNLASEAFLVAGSTGWLTVNRLWVQANSSNAGFAAVRMKQGDAAGFTDDDRDKGNFWNKFNEFWCRKLTGADANEIAMGIDAQGCQNDLSINGGSIQNVTTGVLIRNQNSSILSGISNQVQLLQTAFEGFGTGIKYQQDGAATPALAGGAAIGCRFENGTLAVHSALTNTPSVPFAIVAPTVISSVTTFLTDVRASKDSFNVIGGSITPSREQRFSGSGQLFVQNIAGATGDPALAVGSRQQSNGGAIALRRNDGTVDGLISQRAGGGMDIGSPTVGILRAANVAGISGSGTHANNLRGTVTLLSGTTSIAVTFGTAEADATYRVFLEPNYSTTAWVTAKGTGGFTINVGTAPGANTTVGWLLVR